MDAYKLALALVIGGLVLSISGASAASVRRCGPMTVMEGKWDRCSKAKVACFRNQKHEWCAQ